MNIVFCGTGWFPVLDAIRARLPKGVTLRSWDPSLPLVDQVRDADVLLPSNGRADAAVVHAPARLALIQQPAAGTDGIDLDAARARGVPVCNAPGANHRSMAETALLLILMLARRVPVAREAFAARSIGAPVGFELAGKTLGLVGLGQSGAALATAAQGLGMQVIAVRSGSTREDLLELAARADVLSLHCPLTPSTRGMIDGVVLARMKPGALLINCARGPIVDRAALRAALAEGRLGGVGLDVFWEEPWEPADPLYARPDVVTLPHIGGSTAEAFARIADIVAGNVGRLLRGEPLLHRIA